MFCIIIAVVSNRLLAKNYASPDYETNQKTIRYLDEKKTTALELCAGATALSAVITMVPGDTGTPIAEKLTDLSGYFLIVVSAIYLEKYLLTILGALTFKWLIPIAMVALALYFGMKKDIFGKLGAKILVFGLAVLIVTTCLIPVLVMVFFVWLVKLLLGNWKSSLPC